MNQKKFLLFYSVLFTFLMYSCANEKGKTGQNAETGYDEQFINKSKNKTLLIIADDRSGSTGDIRKMNANDYADIFKAYAEKHYGQIAVRVIGNPAPQDKQLYLLEIKNYLPYQKIPAKEKMSIKAKIRNKNKEIAQQNLIIDRENQQKIDEYVQTVIKPHIIAYKPYKNRDITNVEDAFAHIDKKISEPTFDNYDNIQVVIISDGIHDATRVKKPLKLNPTKHNDKIQVFLIGWKDTKPFKDIKNVSEFESIESFKSYYKQNQ